MKGVDEFGGSQSAPIHAASVGAARGKSTDKSARLAIEAGPGQGYEKALMDMASIDIEVGQQASAEAETDDANRSGGACAKSEGEGLSDPASPERVTIDELTMAATESAVTRLVVVTPFADEASERGVAALARVMTQQVHPVALLQFARSESLGAGMRDQKGWLDVVGGAIGIGEAIHRDDESLLHVVPSGGIDIEALDPDELADLAFYLEAFQSAYRSCIVHLPIAALEHLDGLKGAETAIVVAASGTNQDDVVEIAALIAEQGYGEVLHLLCDETDEKPVYN
ncbi:MAG: hypothetical protein KAG89_18890 [Fulvimarina manganoxydans]|uniref:hypothetical protein n=1 Tax=Fulvimarina manganoxydans TaxID=937218 RepID=UPI0023544EE3|nr:hypothetical protein [Fulvimarina manganoxydans]MCK5934229.1 hypothetical protein [Fulvimarina manganoxydans]